MCLEIGSEPLPDQAVCALASALKPLEPQPCGLEVHLLKAPAVAVHSEVLEMPSQSPAERGVLVLAAGEIIPFVADEKVTRRRPRSGR